MIRCIQNDLGDEDCSVTYGWLVVSSTGKFDFKHNQSSPIYIISNPWLISVHQSWKFDQFPSLLVVNITSSGFDLLVLNVPPWTTKLQHIMSQFSPLLYILYLHKYSIYLPFLLSVHGVQTNVWSHLHWLLQVYLFCYLILNKGHWLPVHLSINSTKRIENYLNSLQSNLFLSLVDTSVNI